LEHPSDVTIRIYTLVGELVWTKSITGLSAQIYDDLVTWDGKNDRGNTVLNGVYLCTIEIKPTDGGKAARYITKIAYIK
jgi:flagellar hook assembly protein FlgD